MPREKEPVFVLARDVVIPAGTVLSPEPSRTMRIYPHVGVVLENGPDSTSGWHVDLAEALETGLVREQEA